MSRFNQKETGARRRKSKGQSFIELAVVLSVLLLLLAGMAETGFLLNQYINVVDAARSGAREASVADPMSTVYDPTLGASPRDKFLLDVPAVVEKALDPIKLRPTCVDKVKDPCDDIVITVYSLTQGQSPVLIFTASKYGNQTTKFTTSMIAARLDASAPNTGLVVIEVFYAYSQMLKLPGFTMFGDPIHVHTYSTMPLSAAEPTPTP